MDPAQLAALYSPAYLKEDRSQQLWNLAIAFGVLECVFVVLFFYSRLKCKIAFGLELYLVVLGFLFVFGHVVVAFGESSSALAGALLAPSAKMKNV